MLNKLLASIVNLFKESKSKSNAREKGKQGERQVQDILSGMGKYCLTNLYIPTYYGYSEIDLVVVDKTGIYVIEVKNYSCKVVGKDNEKEWKTIYPNKSEYTLYNPIMQNESHIKAVINCLGSEVERKLKSYVVFSDNADLSGIKNSRKGVEVLRESEFKISIQKDFSKRYDILSEQEVRKIYNILSKYTNAPKRIKKKHIKNIKSYKRKVT